MTNYSDWKNSELIDECENLSLMYSIALGQIKELKLRVECAAGSIELMQEYAPKVRCDLLAATFRDAVSKMMVLE